MTEAGGRKEGTVKDGQAAGEDARGRNGGVITC